MCYTVAMDDSVATVIAFCEEHHIPCQSVRDLQETLIRVFQALALGDIPAAKDSISVIDKTAA
jgi:hypothetical protein